jgi:hypothetical protein
MRSVSSWVFHLPPVALVGYNSYTGAQKVAEMIPQLAEEDHFDDQAAEQTDHRGRGIMSHEPS